MKRVAIIAADFTPSSLPPALRIRFFAKHLPLYGWQPVIISTETDYYNWPIDEQNNDLLPKNLEIIRTPAISSERARRLGFGDIGLRSLRHHWKKLAELHQENPFDLLFISVPPYFSILLGRLAYMRLKIPYVVDFIDPWVTDYYSTVPRSERPPRWWLANGLSRILEPFALKSVAQVTAVSKGTTDPLVARYKWLNQSQMNEIPYGAEPSDFEYFHQTNVTRVNPIFDANDGNIHVSYPGTFNVSRHQVTRALFEAICLGVKRQPNLFKRLRLHFVGTTYDPQAVDDPEAHYQVMPLAIEAGIEEIVEEHPARVEYLDSLKLLIDSDLLLLIGSDEPHYTASKLFPFILAQRPILAIFHEESSVVSILKETNSGQALTFSNTNPPSNQVEDILEQLVILLDKIDNASFESETNWDAFEQYTTREMTKKLVDAFNKAV